MQSFEALAGAYDKLNQEVDYKVLADGIEQVFSHFGISPELVLDLGCGTGKLTVELARRGYDMIGIDGSEEMLSCAFERKMNEGLHGILLLRQDMREFELYGTVGAVVSSFDCVNYLTEKGDIDRCFSLVHNYLDPGGLFLFDVNTPYKFEHVYGDNAYILETENENPPCFCGWQNAYDQKSGLCRFMLSVFEKEPDGRYRRKDEEQLERCYSQEELRTALERAGFEKISFFGDLQCGAPTADCERWYVSAICKK